MPPPSALQPAGVPSAATCCRYMLRSPPRANTVTPPVPTASRAAAGFDEMNPPRDRHDVGLLSTTCSYTAPFPPRTNTYFVVPSVATAGGLVARPPRAA